MSIGELATAVLLVVGVTLSLLAGLGLQQFPDVFARMHAATKPATLGLLCILFAAALGLDDVGDASKLLLVAVLQFVTAPVGAHMVARAAYRTGTELNPGTVIDAAVESDLGLRGGRRAEPGDQT